MSQKIETPMTTKQKNEVIARHEGLRPKSLIASDDIVWVDDKGLLVYGKLKYHESFEQLMPACQKFCSDDSIVYTNHYLKVTDAITKYLSREATILDIHQALFEGVQWLNKNKEV